MAAPEPLVRFVIARLARTHPLHARLLGAADLEPSTSTDAFLLQQRDFRWCIEFSPARVATLNVDVIARLLVELVDPWIETIGSKPTSTPRRSSADSGDARPPGDDMVAGDEHGPEPCGPSSVPSGPTSMPEAPTRSEPDPTVAPDGGPGVIADADVSQVTAMFVKSTMRLAWEALEDHEVDRVDGHLERRFTRAFGSPAAVRQSVLAELRETVGWRKRLQQFVAAERVATPSYARPARRAPALLGIVPGSSPASARLRVVAVIDTSGSVGHEELRAIGGELARLHRAAAEVVVVECDSEVRRVSLFRGRLREITGRGGTDLRPPFAARLLQRLRPDLIVYFTDGYGPAPARPPGIPVLWCLTCGGTRPAPWGVVAGMPAA